MDAMMKNTLSVGRTSGMTLIELMTVLAVVALLSVMGLPAMKEINKKAEARAQISRIHMTISQAYAHAILNTVPVTLCPLDTNNRCQRTWESTITSFEDHNRDRRRQPEEAIINILAPLQDPSAARNYGRRNALTFDAQGHAMGYNGTFRYCYQGSKHYAGGVIVPGTGRIRKAKDRNADGIAEDSRGRPIEC